MAIPGVPRTNNRDRSRLFSVFDPEIIVNVGCIYLNVTMEVMKGKCRKREVVLPRQVIMYFLAEYTDMTYLSIGKLFNKDHTTVIYSKDTIRNLITTDDDIKERIAGLKKQISDSH
jgi:chromosomal replication initiator protein